MILDEMMERNSIIIGLVTLAWADAWLPREKKHINDLNSPKRNSVLKKFDKNLSSQKSTKNFFIYRKKKSDFNKSVFQLQQF